MEFNYNGQCYNVTSVLNRMDHSIQIKKRQEMIKDYLEFRDSGMTVLTKTNPKIELSKGCQACKSGTWWCLFVGSKCNASCKFCPQDKTYEALNAWEHPRTINNYWIDDVKFYLDKFGDKLTGVSYSGGEPIMYLDRILEIGEHVIKSTPHIYQWVYTNGIYINEDRLKKLADVGIKEVRFDLTATNFNDEIVNKLEMTKKIIGKVTVEVVSIPETCQKLIDEKYIHRLVDMGVEQLNLAEMQLTQDINWRTYATGEDVYSYDTITGVSYAPVYSRHLTISVMEYAIKNRLNILINDCSLDTKHLQGVMRTTNSPIHTR